MADTFLGKFAEKYPYCFTFVTANEQVQKQIRIKTEIDDTYYAIFNRMQYSNLNGEVYSEYIVYAGSAEDELAFRLRYAG